MTKEYNQVEEIDYGETYTLIARLEEIRLFCHSDDAWIFKLYHMDIKFVFGDGFINEEIYVSQPSNFEDCDNSDHIFKLTRTLYGLKQAPEA